MDGWNPFSLWPGFLAAGELILLGFEEDIERGEGSVGAGDVLLEFHFISVIEARVGVDFLFEDAKVVSEHHNFVEEGFDGDVLGLQGGVRRFEKQGPVQPFSSQAVDFLIRVFQTEVVDGGFDDIADEFFEGEGEAGEHGLRFSGCDCGGFRADGFDHSIEIHIGCHRPNRHHHPVPIHGMPDFHPNSQVF